MLEEKSVINDLIEAEDTLEETNQEILPVLPLKNLVALPSSIVPVIVGRQSSIKAVEFALKHNNKTIFVTAQKNPDTENPTLDDIYAHGTFSTILQMIKMPNGSLKILIEGFSRAQVIKDESHPDFLAVKIEHLATDTNNKKSEITAAWRQLQNSYQSYTKLNSKVPADLMTMARDVDDQESVTDTIAVHANLSFDDRQKILETKNLVQRMIDISIILQKEIEILEAEQRIKGRIQNQVEKNQREYYLSEQIKAIHKELGHEDQTEEINELRKKIKALKLPKDVAEKAEKEVRKLEQMPPMSSEAGVSKHYLDWIINLPWHKVTKDNISLTQAEKILDKQHAGLKKVKERIIEFLAAKKFAQDLRRSPIICLLGPPGVGKTSLASSIAASLGREFARISLGGVKDEAEIRGHRRTYIGALPGKIIQAMRKTKTVNPVILLDEIDKIAKDISGDPASALLEVLDPEQNRTFTDHFLDAEYDLSQVMFIATANMVDTIPYALYDRMEIISLSGYTEKEKLFIAKKFLIPKHLKEHSLTKRQFKIDSDTTLVKVINDYTKEAGVRQLERVVTKLIRKSIQELLKDSKKKSVTVTSAKAEKWLGYSKFQKTDVSLDDEKVGLVTGLAWTELGGDVLEIEVSLIPGKGNFTLTGQLGEVMQESAQAAFSYIKENATRLNISRALFNNKDIHIHVPEGSTPKDGPSAGISICTALVSILTGIAVKNHLAMTGEITLRGRVLAIGGVKEKVLAAQQYNIKTVIMPKANENDTKELPEELENVNIVFAKHMDEVLEAALETSPFKKRMKKRVVRKPSTKKKK